MEDVEKQVIQECPLCKGEGASCFIMNKEDEILYNLLLSWVRTQMKTLSDAERVVKAKLLVGRDNTKALFGKLYGLKALAIVGVFLFSEKELIKNDDCQNKNSCRYQNPRKC